MAEAPASAASTIEVRQVHLLAVGLSILVGFLTIIGLLFNVAHQSVTRDEVVEIAKVYGGQTYAGDQKSIAGSLQSTRDEVQRMSASLDRLQQQMAGLTAKMDVLVTQGKGR